MVIADPAAELLELVRALGDPAPSEAPPASRRRAELVRRRFGLALPPPFASGTVAPPDAGGGRAGRWTEAPVRRAVAEDGPAIAAVKWRVMGTSYRGLLDDAFLDGRGIVPPVAYWIGRAMVPPSRRHGLLVWGRPGEVLGYIETGPAEAPVDVSDAEVAGEAAEGHGVAGETAAGGMVETGGEAGASAVDRSVGEVLELYVDPSCQGRGGGGLLLAAGEELLDAAGFDRLELNVLADNGAAQGFYRASGWEPTGRRVRTDLGVVSFDELRMRRSEP